VSALVLGMAIASGAAAADTQPIQITWWHSMGGDLGEEVNELAEEFNESQSQYEVKPIYKGQYAQSLTEAIAAFRAHKQPDILQVYEVGTSTMLAADNAIVPVYKLMKEADVK